MNDQAKPDPRPPVVIALHVEAFGGSENETFEIDRNEWDAMTPDERRETAQQAADDMAANYVSWGWHIYDEADYASTDNASGHVQKTGEQS
jgi:hypothetical protein